EVSSQNPLVQADFGALEHSANSHGKGFAAFVALMNARASRLALQLLNAGHIAVAAMGADRTVWPMNGLKVFPCLLGVCVNFVVECKHSRRPLSILFTKSNVVRQVYNWEFNP